METAALNQPDETKARMELATKRYHDWKEIFSGALNDKQLLCGILLISCFYVFRSIFNIAVIGNDEDKDSKACQCTLSERLCLQIIIAGFCLCWVACFAIIVIYDLYRLGLHFSSQSTERAAESIGGEFFKLDDKLTLYESYLWLEFYKAYSVGSGVYENRNRSSSSDTEKYGWLLEFYKTFDKVFKAEKQQDEADGRCSSTMCTSACCKWLEKLCDKIIEITKKILKAGEKLAKQSYYFLYPFLVIVRLLVQLTLVPLLLLRMLDINTWICVIEDDQCDNSVASSQLGLYQAYMTFSFYIAVLVAILASTMLRWFPQSKDARDASASSFM